MRVRPRPVPSRSAPAPWKNCTAQRCELKPLSAQRTFMIDAEGKLRDASRALEEAQSRLQAKEDHLTAMEFRAQAAEVEAREAKQSLALVEEAIRRRLLCASSKVDTGLTSEASSSPWLSGAAQPGLKLGGGGGL